MIIWQLSESISDHKNRFHQTMFRIPHEEIRGYEMIKYVVYTPRGDKMACHRPRTCPVSYRKICLCVYAHVICRPVTRDGFDYQQDTRQWWWPRGRPEQFPQSCGLPSPAKGHILIAILQAQMCPYFGQEVGGKKQREIVVSPFSNCWRWKGPTFICRDSDSIVQN